MVTPVIFTTFIYNCNAYLDNYLFFTILGWHGENQNKRIGKRLELGCHYDKHEDDNQYAECSQIAERILLVFKGTRHLNGYIGRFLHSIDNGIARSHHVTQTERRR